MPYKSNPNSDGTEKARTAQAKSSNTTWTSVANLASTNLTGCATISNMATTTGTFLSSNGTFGNTMAMVPTPPPANWKTIKLKPNNISFGDDEVHEPPIVGQAAFFASLMVCNHYGRHHWKVFTKLHPKVEYLACGVADSEGVSTTTLSNIIFFREDDYVLFEDWFADYLEMFGDKSILYACTLPPPPPVMHYSVQVPMGRHEDISDLSVWLMANCQDRVYSLSQMLFFLNDEDATLYKLKFGGK